MCWDENLDFGGERRWPGHDICCGRWWYKPKKGYWHNYYQERIENTYCDMKHMHRRLIILELQPKYIERGILSRFPAFPFDLVLLINKFAYLN